MLFIWSKENHTISYRQGMNEVAASLIHVYFQECQNQKSISEYNLDKELEDTILLFNDVKYAEADIYALFVKVMNDAQHMEMFRPNYTGT